MTSAPVQIENMTLTEFVRLYDQEGPFELIHGERVKLMPPVFLHGLIIKLIVQALLKVEQAGIGEVFFEIPFVLVDSSDWVKGSRVPDVMFFRADRIKDYRSKTPDWKNKPFVLVPDLAVEVVSQNDIYSAVDEKVALYLSDGVQIIWVIDPKRRKVIIHTANQQIRLSD